MNFYTFIPLGTFLVNVFTWTYIYAQKRFTPVNKAYLSLSASLALWMFNLFLLWSPVQESLVIFLEKSTTTIGFIVVISLINFTFVFLEKKKNFLYYTIISMTVLLAFINIFTDSYMAGYTKHPWGVTLKPGPLHAPIVFCVFIAPVSFALYLLYKEIHCIKNANTKKQLILLMQGIGLSFLINVISDFVLPHVFGLTHIVRLGIPGCVVESIFIFMAVKKYNFLSMSFEEISNALFQNLQDAIVLIDREGFVVQTNDSARQFLHFVHPHMHTVHMGQYVDNYHAAAYYRNHETVAHTRHGERLVSLSQADVNQYNVEVGKILIMRDITDSKKAQRELYDHKEKLEHLAHELAEINTSLEQKVLERTMSLQSSNEHLQREIRERTRVEAALAAEKERLTVTLRSIADGVITTDTRGTAVLLNQVAEALTGWSQSQALGKPLYDILDLLDEKTRQPCQHLIEDVLHSDGGGGQVRYFLLRTHDGTERIVAENGAPIRDTDGSVLGAVLVFRDITEMRKIEEELIKTDKLESIGLLAGGIAHDFNNILMAIVGNISLAKLCLSDESDVLQILDAAENASLKAQHLTQQLLTFAKGGLPVKTLVSIKDVLKEAVEFSLHGSHVRCALAVSDDLWPACVDEGQIGQVINNLVINASQAMPQGGVLEVEAENLQMTEENLEHFVPLQAGKYVKILVKDHGIGIAEEHLQKIFDPYFTTKEKGNGLGLFTSYSIIKKHDGYIHVDSTVGVGTTFTLYLPAVDADVTVVQSQPQDTFTGTGRILVLDDEEMIREVTCAILERFGYTVDLAADGTQALALYTQASQIGQPYDAVIMDLTIPGSLGGKDTMRQLLEIDPAAKGIVVSGYSNDPILAQYSDYGFRGYLVKPYKSQDLLHVLQQVLTT